MKLREGDLEYELRAQLEQAERDGNEFCAEIGKLKSRLKAVELACANYSGVGLSGPAAELAKRILNIIK